MDPIAFLGERQKACEEFLFLINFI
jgi:hypothetical protein